MKSLWSRSSRLMAFPIFSLLSLIRLLLCACIPHSNTKNLQFTSFQRVAVHRPSPPSRPPPDSTLFRWVFFDDEKTSETYAEQLTHCPEYGRSLERKALRATTPSLLP